MSFRRACKKLNETYPQGERDRLAGEVESGLGREEIGFVYGGDVDL